MPKKQKSDLYRSKVKIGVDAKGKDVVKWISGKTKKELEEHRQKVIAYYIEGSEVAEDKLFGEYVVEWFKVRKEPFISASTRNNYRTMLNKHILPTFGDRKLRAIRPVELQEFVNGFAGMSKSQISSAMDTLREIFAAAVQDRLVGRNPAENLTRPKAKPPREKEALTDEERARIVALFDTHPHGLYLAVMYYTGMRPGEVRGLMWGDIDWQEGLIHVQRDVDYATSTVTVGELKTKASERFVPLMDELRALLYPRRELPNTFIFPGRDGKPLAQVTAIRMWIELMVACDMADPITETTCYGPNDIRGKYRPRITPHAMRHNFITMCWENGLDEMLTMRIVGHTDYETTRNIYTHLSRKHLEHARLQLEGMFSDPKTKVAQKLHNSKLT